MGSPYASFRAPAVSNEGRGITMSFTWPTATITYLPSKKMIVLKKLLSFSCFSKAKSANYDRKRHLIFNGFSSRVKTFLYGCESKIFSQNPPDYDLR